MQNIDGTLTMLGEKQFKNFLEHGTRNVVTVGDVFKIRKCYFRVENISDYGLSARGISRKEFFDSKRK